MLDENSIPEDLDLIAIGAGFAGLAAGCRAAQLGLKVAVLERETGERYLNSSRYATGAFAIMGGPMRRSADAIYEAIIEGTNGEAQPDLARMIASNVQRTVEWLVAEGARFIELPSFGNHSVLAPPRRMMHGLDWEGRGADVLMRTLERNLNARGGRLYRGATVLSLLHENGACVGVAVSHNGKEKLCRAKAVVIADGGFQANHDMVRQYICSRPESVLLRAAPGGKGDGIRMAEAIGAKIGGFGKFYGHLQHRDAFSNVNLWPYPQFDAIAESGLLVDQSGKRFTDEGLGGVAMANAIAQLDDPLSAFVIYDEAMWNGAPGSAIPVATNRYLAPGGGWMHSASTIVELARLTNLPVDALCKTIDQHNAAVKDDSFVKLTPPRSTRGSLSYGMSGAKSYPLPIVQPPYHAVPLCAGITLAMGGIAINTNAQAIRDDGEPIPGLYVSGTPVSGLEGGPRAGYVGGLCKAFVLGVIAAEHATDKINS